MHLAGSRYRAAGSTKFDAQTKQERKLIMYNSKSRIATEFIDDAEIKRTLAWAEENKNDLETIRGLLARAKDCKGLTYQEAMLLLECDDPQIHEEIFQLANEIKEKFYGNRIVMFAPLYLSNYCVNGCVYCPYHGQNKTIKRKKLTQEEIVWHWKQASTLQ